MLYSCISFLITGWFMPYTETARSALSLESESPDTLYSLNNLRGAPYVPSSCFAAKYTAPEAPSAYAMPPSLPVTEPYTEPRLFSSAKAPLWKLPRMNEKKSSTPSTVSGFASTAGTATLSLNCFHAVEMETPYTFIKEVANVRDCMFTARYQ